MASRQSSEDMWQLSADLTAEEHVITDAASSRAARIAAELATTTRAAAEAQGRAADWAEQVAAGCWRRHERSTLERASGRQLFG